MKKILYAVLGIAGIAAAHSQVAYDFNAGQADFDANFVRVNGSYSAAWTNGTTTGNGVGASGSGYLATASDQTAYYGLSAGQFNTAGDTKFVSYYFKAGINTSNNFDNNTGVGFNTVNTAALASGSYAFAVMKTLSNDGTNATSVALGVNYRNGGSGATAIDTSFGNLAQNTWYQLRLDLTYQGSNAFSAQVSLFDWGLDGVTGGSLLDTFTTPLNGSSGSTMSTFVNTDLNSGFRSQTANAGIRALQVDNFSATAVPEPSALALLFGGGLTMLLLRRRRNSTVA